MNSLRTILIVVFLFCFATSWSPGFELPPGTGNPSETPRNFKIAFLGDQGLGLGAEKVLELVKSEESKYLSLINEKREIREIGASHSAHSRIGSHWRCLSASLLSRLRSSRLSA